MNYSESTQSNVFSHKDIALIREIELTKITKRQIMEKSKSAEKRMESFRKALFSKA